MAGFCRMYKHGRGAGRGQRCRYLAANVTAFSHAHNHHAATAGQHDVDGMCKTRSDAACQIHDGSGFYLKSFPGESLCLLCVKGGCVKIHTTFYRAGWPP